MSRLEPTDHNSSTNFDLLPGERLLEGGKPRTIRVQKAWIARGAYTPWLVDGRQYETVRILGPSETKQSEAAGERHAWIETMSAIAVKPSPN